MCIRSESGFILEKDHADIDADGNLRWHCNFDAGQNTWFQHSFAWSNYCAGVATATTSDLVRSNSDSRDPQDSNFLYLV